MCGSNEMTVQGISQDHFLCCTKSFNRQQQRIALLTQQTTKIHTPPHTRKMLIDIIIRFYENKPPVTEHKIHEDFILHQTEIGWRHFMRGMISKHILPLINADFKKKPPPNRMNAIQ